VKRSLRWSWEVKSPDNQGEIETNGGQKEKGRSGPSEREEKVSTGRQEVNLLAKGLTMERKEEKDAPQEKGKEA